MPLNVIENIIKSVFFNKMIILYLRYMYAYIFHTMYIHFILYIIYIYIRYYFYTHKGYSQSKFQKVNRLYTLLYYTNIYLMLCAHIMIKN